MNIKQVARELKTTPEKAATYFVKKYGLTPTTNYTQRYDPNVVRPLIKATREEHRKNLRRRSNVKSKGLSRKQLPKKQDFQQLWKNIVASRNHPISHQAVISAPTHLIGVTPEEVSNFNNYLERHIDDISKKISRRFSKLLRKHLGYTGAAAKVVPLDWYQHVFIAEKKSKFGHQVAWHFHIAFFLDAHEANQLDDEEALIKNFLKSATKSAFEGKYQCRANFDVALSKSDDGFISYLGKAIDDEDFYIHISGKS